MLRRIGEDGVEKWSAERIQSLGRVYGSALTGLGVPEAELDGAVDRVCAALTATLADERGRWILSSGEGTACEIPITGVLDGKTLSVRIDRTLLDRNGTRWVVDYKTSSHEGSGLEGFLDNESARYSDQLLTYKRLFRAFEDRSVRTALYFPLLQAWREVELEAEGQEAAHRQS
jgi:hypothetical protein